MAVWDPCDDCFFCFGADPLERRLTAYSVEKLLLIWVLAAGSIILLILEFARDDGTTSGSTICSFLRLFD